VRGTTNVAPDGRDLYTSSSQTFISLASLLEDQPGCFWDNRTTCLRYKRWSVETANIGRINTPLPSVLAVQALLATTRSRG
jgi:hypothetical protein